MILLQWADTHCRIWNLIWGSVYKHHVSQVNEYSDSEKESSWNYISLKIKKACKTKFSMLGKISIYISWSSKSCFEKTTYQKVSPPSNLSIMAPSKLYSQAAQNSVSGWWEKHLHSSLECKQCKWPGPKGVLDNRKCPDQVTNFMYKCICMYVFCILYIYLMIMKVVVDRWWQGWFLQILL